MNDKEIYLLENYQHLMQSHEKMVARWLTEEWDGTTQELPKWLRNRVLSKFTMRDFGKPDAMARAICLRLLEKYKHELSLPKEI